MSPPGEPRDLVSALGRRRRLARLALWWEAVWPRAWPVLAVLGIFLIIALLDLPQRLPGIRLERAQTNDVAVEHQRAAVPEVAVDAVPEQRHCI